MKFLLRAIILLVLSFSGTTLVALELKPSQALGGGAGAQRAISMNPTEAMAREHKDALELFATGWCTEGQAVLLRMKVLSFKHKIPTHDFVAEKKQCAEYRMEGLVTYMRLAYFTQDLNMVKRLAEEARQLALASDVDIPDDILSMTKKMASGYCLLLYLKLKGPAKPPTSI